MRKILLAVFGAALGLVLIVAAQSRTAPSPVFVNENARNEISKDGALWRGHAEICIEDVCRQFSGMILYVSEDRCIEDNVHRLSALRASLTRRHPPDVVVIRGWCAVARGTHDT